jgi:hypothetical protein
MNCIERHIDISAYLDGALEKSREAELLLHLEGCRDCREFYEEHHKMDALITDVYEDIEIPDRIWNRIEINLEERKNKGERSWLAGFFSHFEIPQLAYGFAALLLFGLASLLALQVYDEFSAHPSYLAELDSFTVDIQGNPFLEVDKNDQGNPFWDSMVSNDLVNETNPFVRNDEVVK